MYIKTVIGQNIKARTLNRNFSPMSIIVGENMTGKTALLDAIRLAWQGFTLGAGKKPGDIFATFASADSMTAALYFDDGMSLERVWTKKGDKVSCTVRNPHSISVPPVLLDSSEFFELSAEARLALLFGRMNLGKEPIQMRVRNVLDRMASVPAARDLLAKKYQPGPEESFQAYLERVITKMGEEAKDARDTAKRHKEAAAGMMEAQLKAAAGNEAAFQEDEVQRDMASAKTRLEDLLAEKGAADQRQAARAPSIARLNKLKGQIANASPLASAYESYEQAVKDCESALASYADKESVQAAQDRLNDSTRRRSEAAGTKSASERELRSVEAEHAAILNAECCPTCATKKAGWKAVTVEKFTARQKELTDTLTAATESLEGLAVEVATNERLVQAARQMEAAKRDATKKRDEQANQLARAKQAREFIAEVTPEVEDLERAFPADAATREAEEIASLQDAITDAREAVALQAGRLQKIADTRLDEQRLAETTEARDKAQTLADAYKAGQGQLQEIRDGFMADAFAPLVKSVNRYAAGILKSPLEFRANSLGRVHEEKKNWVPIAGFSGTETAIMLAGVQLALGSESKAKVAIVDELGRIDVNRKRQLMRNIAAAIEDGTLDQFIGVDLTDDAYGPLLKPESAATKPLALTLVKTA